ncbi:MAG: hypothetical protein DRI86_08680 [Bacteroidetes bacterium]|nr:MAG: hypothetical protein DRI86_08680 [Bacteroidota bacterium]
MRTSNYNNTLYVADKYRTNPLSLDPGGSTVYIKLEDGRELAYDKIKNVSAYIYFLKEKKKLKIASYRIN